MFAEPTSTFFADFGTNATWQAATISGLFDSAYAEAFGTMGGSGPRFLCAAADVPGIAHGQTMNIAGRDYLVAAVKHDGTGLVSLDLEEA